MAIHLEAVYEQGVLRPLEPLALAEHQRVHVTVDERRRPLSWESAQQPDDSRAELDWLANESRHYTGEWVALDGNRLVAHGPKLAAVKAAAHAARLPLGLRTARYSTTNRQMADRRRAHWRKRAAKFPRGRRSPWLFLCRVGACPHLRPLAGRKPGDFGAI